TGLAINPTGRRLYVADAATGQVVVVNLDTRKVLARVNAAEQPFGVTADPATQRVFVTGHAGGNVAVITEGTITRVTANVRVGDQPVGVAFDPGANRLYVANQGSNSVSVIDAGQNQVIKTVAVGAEPYG